MRLKEQDRHRDGAAGAGIGRASAAGHGVAEGAVVVHATGVDAGGAMESLAAEHGNIPHRGAGRDSMRAGIAAFRPPGAHAGTFCFNLRGLGA